MLLLLSCDEEHVNIFATHSKWVGAKFTHRITSLEDDLCPFKYWWHSHSNMMRINCANHGESPKLCYITIQRFLSCIFCEWCWTISCWEISETFLLSTAQLPGRRFIRLDGCQRPGSAFAQSSSPLTQRHFPEVYFLRGRLHLGRWTAPPLL